MLRADGARNAESKVLLCPGGYPTEGQVAPRWPEEEKRVEVQACEKRDGCDDMRADEAAAIEIPGEHQRDEENVAVVDVEEEEEGCRWIGWVDMAEETGEAGAGEGDAGENHHPLMGGGVPAERNADGEQNEEGTDVEELHAHEGIGKGAMLPDVHHDRGVKPDGSHYAHKAGPCGEKPS